MLVLYFGISFVRDSFFTSRIIIWVTIYFVIAYMQKYMLEFQNNRKINVLFFLTGLICHIGIIAITNLMGLYIPLFSDKVLYWLANNNPFILLMAVCLLNIVRNIHWKNRVVNYISSLSLLIYIIHDNIILRRYVRPTIFQYIYQTYGYAQIVMWVVIVTVCIFILSLLCAMVYQKTLQKQVQKCSEKLFILLPKIYIPLENVLLKVK